MVIRKLQNNFTTGVLSPGLYGRTDLSKYANGCKRLENAVIYAHGGVAKRPGTLYVDTLPADGLLFPFTYSTEQAYCLCFYGNSTYSYAVMRVYLNGELVLKDGQVYEVETPYRPNAIRKIKFAQSADTMFLAHPSYRPYKLMRYDHNDWRFEEMTFYPNIAAPENLKGVASNFVDESGTYVETSTSYKVAAVNEKEVESMPSSSVTVKTLSTWPSGAKVTLTWNAVEGAVRYEVYKDERGYYAWIGSAEKTKFTDNNIEGDSSTGPKENRDPFVGKGNYPGAVGIYQQRLIFGRSNNQPQTVWCSESGAFDSMAVAQPLRDDSAITATVDSKQLNDIRHFIPLRDMLMLTSGAEFKMHSGSAAGAAITPTSIAFDIQSYWGCSDVPPIVTGTSVLLVQNSGKVVRDLRYTLEEDGYSGSDVSVLAEHLLTSPVLDWAFQQDPFSALWICLNNGKLLTFTYMREQEVWAWSTHSSSGAKFRSVCCVRENAADNLYFLVKRSDQYFIEYQKRREYGDALEDAFFVDCGLQYSGDSVTQITGLSHLAGKKISVLGDGVVYRNIKVSTDGKITLPKAVSKASAGLPYSTVIETLDQEIKSESGVLFGDKRTVVRTALMLRESAGLSAGPDEDHLVEVKLSPRTTWGFEPDLYSGIVNLALRGLHREESTIVIKAPDPLPMTVLCISNWIGI